MICVFYAQTVWPSTLPHTNGLACNFYAQTVWPPTKLATQRVGEEFEATPQHPKKATPAPPRPWPPTHPYRRSDQELATPPAQVVRKHPRRHSPRPAPLVCNADKGGVPLPQRVSIFYDFFTLKFSPVKFVQPLGGVVQNKCVCDFFTLKLAIFKGRCDKFSEI